MHRMQSYFLFSIYEGHSRVIKNLFYFCAKFEMHVHIFESQFNLSSLAMSEFKDSCFEEERKLYSIFLLGVRILLQSSNKSVALLDSHMKARRWLPSYMTVWIRILIDTKRTRRKHFLNKRMHISSNMQDFIFE